MDTSKTVCGIIPSFSAIFTGARYARQLYSDRKRGTAYDHRPGEVSIIVERDCVGLPETFCDSFRSILVATPSEQFMKPRFSPRIATRGTWQSIPPSCVRIIPWHRDGHFLVLAGDPNHIREEWFGFVPFGQTFGVT